MKNLLRRISDVENGIARSIQMEPCSSERAVMPGLRLASTATKPICTIASCSVSGKSGVCTLWPTSRYPTKPSEVMWLNHNCGVRTSVHASLRKSATHGLALTSRRMRCALGRRTTVIDSLHPCAKLREMKASAGGQSTIVAKSKSANQSRAVPTWPMVSCETTLPIHVLGSQLGGGGSWSVDISPCARAMPEKLATQNTVGTIAPKSQSVSLACCDGI